MASPKIHILEGDITKHPCDAIMTAINSEGMWFGGVDSAIMRVANNHYHKQAAAKMPLKDLDIIVARGHKSENNYFDDVIFVVDDLQSPVAQVVYAGLCAANTQPYQTIALPAVRMGVMLGVRERTAEQTALGIRMGIVNFLNDNSESMNLKNVDFVCYKDPRAVEALKKFVADI